MYPVHAIQGFLAIGIESSKSQAKTLAEYIKNLPCNVENHQLEGHYYILQRKFFVYLKLLFCNGFFPL